MSLFKFNNSQMGIDLGTSSILIALKDKGIVYNEPSVIAVDTLTKEIIAIGLEAKEMLGKNPDDIEVICPVQDGVIADYIATEALIKKIFNKICKRYFIKNPKVIVSIPSGITEVEERAVEEVLMAAGSKEVYLIEEPMASAIGANLQVAEPTGNIIVDIGGGTTEVAVISLGGVVVSNSIKVAGDALDNAIINYIKKEMNVLIGKNTAEKLKIEIANAISNGEEEKYQIVGRELNTGLPMILDISSKDVHNAIKECLFKIIDCIKITLEKTPPELAADLGEKGIYLAGGGALIKNLDKLISYKTEMPVYIAENAVECVVKGTAKTFENFDTLKSVLLNKKK